MLSVLLFWVTALLSLVSSAPTSQLGARGSGYGSGYGSGSEVCDEAHTKVRVDFNSMPPEQRIAYTDAVKCIMAQPSQLDSNVYPAATNRYMDYAVIHVNRTQQVHLSAYFLTWHRTFLHLYEEDLRHTCGYRGPFPYWDFAATADNPTGYPIFDGSAASMSGDGVYNNTGPITLGPALTIPHGTGGGCVTAGPFANMIAPLKFIDPSQLQTGVLPDGAFNYNEICLMRDLNAYVAQTYTNKQLLTATAHADNASHFEYLLNGVIGSASLGVHSGAHFAVGGQMNSIHVSAQDPIWYPLHTMIDKLYWSWQTNYPDRANEIDTELTGTALNTPPSGPVDASSVMPDWGYLGPQGLTVGDALSTTAGPFCYKYDNVIS